ncbi:MAG: hypothetical protein R3B53_00255 [Candidatus Paceibacterota bacterium]
MHVNFGLGGVFASDIGAPVFEVTVDVAGEDLCGLDQCGVTLG